MNSGYVLNNENNNQNLSKKEKEKEKEDKTKYASSCNLNENCAFGLRSGNAETNTLKFWQESNVWNDVANLNTGSEKWTLHDGPPFANGHLHVGHALNKVLKDSLSKFHRSNGKHVDLVVGWDCHGLPVEYAVTLENPGLKDPKELREKCRQYAQKWMNVQKEEFQRLGVAANYEHSYKTMDPLYEADVLRVFGKFVENGLVDRRFMTVPWCGHCSSTLAKAEMEYKTKTDTSCFALFPFTQKSLLFFKSSLLKEKNLSDDFQSNVAFVAWTTTPYSLPLNRALALSPTGKMVLVRVSEKGKLAFNSNDVASYPLFLMAEESYKDVMLKVGVSKFQVLLTLENSFFSKMTETEKWTVMHPFDSNYEVPVLLDMLVELKEKNDKATNMENEGEEEEEENNNNKQEKTSDKQQKKKKNSVVSTGVVHLAPGLGVEDYRVAQAHKLELFCPVSKFGTYEKNDHLPAALEGKALMTEGKTWALQNLKERNLLFFQEPLSHSYPHCWRCKNPLLFRTTQQYFCAVDTCKVRNVLKHGKFVPSDGKQEFERVLQNRVEWCVSRQRVFGVPVVAVNFKDCDHSFTSPEMVEFVAKGVEKSGLDYWADLSESELRKFLPTRCSKCQNSNMNEFTKEKDVLDVWFDSGASNYAVLKRNKNLKFPADVYLEGKDQYRGWFQSSFLCSYVMNEEMTPVKTVVTHGFVVDEQGRKFSKSVGNGVNLAEAMSKTNADTVRLWALTTDFTKDVALSMKLLENVAGEYRKLRGCLRFMLQNVTDGTFDPQNDLLSFDKLHPTDQYMLVSMSELLNTFSHSFKKFDTNAATTALLAFFRQQVSSYYAEFTKNRLYFQGANSVERKQVQTVLYLVLKHSLPMLATVCTFMAEEVFQFMYSHWPHLKPTKSVLFLQFQNADSSWSWNESRTSLWNLVLNLRHEVNKEVEKERDRHAKTGRPSNQQMQVSVALNSENKEMNQLHSFLKSEFDNSLYAFYASDFFLVSKSELHLTPFSENQKETQEKQEKENEAFKLNVSVLNDQWKQCWRCRRYQLNVEKDSHLCKDCQQFVERK